jgi:hypothetical protein
VRGDYARDAVTTYIVECISCQQPWEVPTYLLSTPEQKILIPGHMMLHLETSDPEARACAGAAFSGIGMGDREGWERRWPSDHLGRPLPVVLDGSASVSLQILD